MTTFAPLPVPAVQAQPAGPAPSIQRCGGVRCPPGTCDHDDELTVRRSADHGVPPALAVGDPDDPDEHEAERVADAISRPDPVPDPEYPPSGPVVRRSADSAARPHASAAVRARIDGLRGGGQPLPGPVRSFFEPRLGHDFSRVRIHTGPDAAWTARALGARAFTVGPDVAFAAREYAPDTGGGRRLLAHELTHVVQQGGSASRVARVQRAGDPAAIPPGFPCPTDLTPGRPTGTDLLFATGGSAVTAAHTTLLTAFVAAWLAAGGTDDVVVDGYASTVGDQGANWTLSCARAVAVQAELVRLGLPGVRIRIAAHGESTDFSASPDPNQRVVVSSRAAGVLPLPLVGGVLTARDSFAGRSTARFGVGETIDLTAVSVPATPAAAFGGLEWHLVSGGGTLAAVTPAGTATYTAPAAAAAVVLELRVATGATAGRVVSRHPIAVVTPNGVRITAVPGTAPNTHPTGPLPPGTWGAGFQGNVFVDPRDVSFQGVVFGEGTVAAVVTPPGSFLSGFAGLAHPVNTFGPGHGGNAVTGTAVSPPVDNISSGGRAPGTVLGVPVCGASDFLWAIPWEFSVSGGARTPFATANHHATSTLLCDASIEKAGAGPFVRSI